jgi:hypothetical protein
LASAYFSQYKTENTFCKNKIKLHHSKFNFYSGKEFNRFVEWGSEDRISGDQNRRSKVY